MRKKRLAVLGSTGSIGHQTLEVVRRHADLFEIELLSANTQWELLVQQSLEFRPRWAVIGDDTKYLNVQSALAGSGVEVLVGDAAFFNDTATTEIYTVVVAIVGYAGLLPTIRAIETGKTVALANKESLVVAGELVMELAARYNAQIIPVDSEHSAIYQCLVGELSPVEKLIITASGGPFRTLDYAALEQVTPIEALHHPAWNMGAKISVDSATMMNKGLEVIEAHWLFSMPYESIEVLVHPQAIIHSMLQFADGAIKAQLGVPDMRLPIQYALTYPYRLESGFKRYAFGPGEDFSFAQPDTDRFPCLALALEAGQAGGNAPCVLNAANEVAVNAFLGGKIGFTTIPKVVDRTLETIPQAEGLSLDDYIATHHRAVQNAQWIVDKLAR